MLILAHTSPPVVLFQLRNFDVPLMFFVMGMSFNLSKAFERNKFSYIVDRFIRLVLPTWIFFCFFYIAITLFPTQLIELDYTTILTTITLSQGIGYVWVIKLFLFISIFAIFLKSSVVQHKFIMLVFGTIVIFLNENTFHDWSVFIDDAVPHWYLGTALRNSIPYLFVFYFGVAIKNVPSKLIYISVVISFGVYLSFSHYSNFGFMTQYNKYPAGLHYLSYAVFIILTLYISCDKIINVLRRFLILNKIIFFIAANTIWIYLWHIPIVTVCAKLKINWFLTYGMAIFLSTSITYLQYRLIVLATSNSHCLFCEKHRKIIYKIFTG